jgi:hypothetical protein
MNFAAAVDRVRADFNQMPELELTIGQAIRLWNIGADDCRYVLDALVDARFLRWTTRRTIVRAGRDGAEALRAVETSYVSVRRARQSDTSGGS